MVQCKSFGCSLNCDHQVKFRVQLVRSSVPDTGAVNVVFGRGRFPDGGCLPPRHHSLLGLVLGQDLGGRGAPGHSVTNPTEVTATVGEALVKFVVTSKGLATTRGHRS